MSDIEEKIFNDILNLIKDNLKILIYNKDSCLYHFTNYCQQIKKNNLPISQTMLTKFTEDALYALLNASFLYDFRDIE